MRALFLFLALFFTFANYAQEPIYKHFGVDEGLPSSQVYDICQDNNGYIWFATDKGVSRYNGYEFENFDTTDGLPGNVVLRFYPQENGEIWGYSNSNKALFYFNKNYDGFKPYKHNAILAKELSTGAVVKSFNIDLFKTISLGGNNINGELFVKDNGSIQRKYTNNSFFDLERSQKHIVLNKDSKKGDAYFVTIDKNSINENISALLQETGHHQATWLLPNKKAVLMNGASIQIISVDKKSTKLKNQFTPLRIKVIDSTQFFVGYHFGGAKIVSDKGIIKQAYLKDKSITNFLIDHDGGYWFTTLNSGVYYVKKPSILTFKSPNNQASLHINSLAKRKNELLIGYNNGDFAELELNKSFKLKKATNTFPPSIVEYDAIFNKTYLYFNNQLFINKKKYSLESYTLKLSEPDLKGTLFESHLSGFYEASKQKDFLLNTRIIDVSIRKKDTLLATYFGVFRKQKDSVIPLSRESKLLGFRSDDIDVSKNEEHIFVATQGAGVVVYGNKTYNISTKDGLTSNIINEIHVENDSTIWACTNKGLNRIVFKDGGYNLTIIDKNSGLLSNEVEDVEIINDTLWVGTKEGLSYMPKKILDAKESENIYLKIKKIKVNDVIYNSSIQSKLKYTENKISFTVEGIYYAKNYDLEYQYRLKEIDKKWNTTKNRSISFPNLKHGNYTFQVRASVGNIIYEKEQLEYQFIIKPPFWFSWWFYTICFFVFCGLIYLFFKIRVLTYNKDVVREFFRLLIKKLKSNEKNLELRINGEDVKIATQEILFIKSSGNYLDIVCSKKTYTIRCKIGDFIATTPDALEYLRIHRSYIIRIDKVTGKSKKSVKINEYKIPVGETYLIQLDHIQF
jgi:hypothetical protein